MHKKITITPYDPNWPSQYAHEAAKIKAALGKYLDNIYHIGSTAVPDLVAKPKIDIIAAVSNPKAMIPLLKSIGYDYKGEWNIPGKFGFTKRAELDVNLHVFEPNHPEIELNILFRDYLRQNPDARASYAALKEQLITEDASHRREQGEFFYGYTVGKGDFIRNILKRTGFNKFRILKASDPVEWEAIEKLRLANHTCQDIDMGALKKESQTYLVLYRGVDIIGYAHVDFSNNRSNVLKELVFDGALDKAHIKQSFHSMIIAWIS